MSGHSKWSTIKREKALEDHDDVRNVRTGMDVDGKVLEGQAR